MTEPASSVAPKLPRVMGLRDVVLFNIIAIVGPRWFTTAASQFGLASLGLWLLAMVVFFLPSALVVRELVEIDPGAGGLYRWVARAFGTRNAFVAGWGYWVNNLFYFPSLLVQTAAILAYAGGPRHVGLADSQSFIAVVSLLGLWLSTWLNLVGLRIGKWLSNIGALWGTWIPTLVFVALGVWVFASHGSATTVTPRAFLPARFDFQSINFFATMVFAFGGLELAPTLGAEIHDPARTLRRGVVLSGLIIVTLYMLGTAALLVALPSTTINITNGLPQAVAAMGERLGAPGLAWLAALMAVLFALGNLGGVGAWAAGSARLPYAAGVDRALPAAFSQIHPRWQTPHIALLVQSALATLFIVASLIGSTVRNAYLLLVQTTAILFFIPFLYMFAAYLRVRRQRTGVTLLTGITGFATVAVAIVLSFVPPPGEPWVLFELKIAGGVIGFMAIGWWLARRA